MDVLDTGIDDSVLVLKEGREMATSDVSVFVDCGGQDKATVFLRPSRIIGSTTKK